MKIPTLKTSGKKLTRDFFEERKFEESEAPDSPPYYNDIESWNHWKYKTKTDKSAYFREHTFSRSYEEIDVADREDFTENDKIQKKDRQQENTQRSSKA